MDTSDISAFAIEAIAAENKHKALKAIESRLHFWLMIRTEDDKNHFFNDIAINWKKGLINTMGAISEMINACNKMDANDKQSFENWIGWETLANADGLSAVYEYYTNELTR